MTILQMLADAPAGDIDRLIDPAFDPVRTGKWDNRPTWDNGPKFDNRKTWDNWNKK
jgi:hypothetical protein